MACTVYFLMDGGYKWAEHQSTTLRRTFSDGTTFSLSYEEVYSKENNSWSVKPTQLQLNDTIYEPGSSAFDSVGEIFRPVRKINAHTVKCFLYKRGSYADQQTECQGIGVQFTGIFIDPRQYSDSGDNAVCYFRISINGEVEGRCSPMDD